MIHVDMKELTEKWYNNAVNGKPVTGANKEEYFLFFSLDKFQRQQLKEAYQQGMYDSVDLLV